MFRDRCQGLIPTVPGRKRRDNILLPQTRQASATAG